MFPVLKQFVPSSVCLTCDGCCRFKEEHSVWRPKVAKEEVSHLRNSGLAAEIFAQDPFLSDGSIRAQGCHESEGFQCSFFKADDNTCRVYKNRPFDCQLYPFVLTHDRGELVLCVHLNCPHVQHTRTTAGFAEYVEYLKGFFEDQKTRNFLKENPSLVGDYARYRHEMETLFSIILD